MLQTKKILAKSQSRISRKLFSSASRKNSTPLALKRTQLTSSVKFQPLTRSASFSQFSQKKMQPFSQPQSKTSLMISKPNFQKKQFSSKSHDSALRTKLTAQIEEMKDIGTYKAERIITGEQDSQISVSQKQVLNFCANNYLGFSNHPALIQASKEALDSHGYGLSSVRFICGTQDIHKTLEQKISSFHEKDDSILYAACFDANAGIFEALFGPEDAILSDSLNHASIIDGVRLAKSMKWRYNHMDMKDLEDKLKEAEDKGAKSKVIVTDGVFSMDGDIAPLEKVCQLADKYQSLVMVDECHGSGFLGKKGRGASELCGVLDRVDIINSTLGKGLGGAIGGFTTSHDYIIETLRNKARPYLFSNSLPPSVVGSSIKVFDMISSDSSQRDRLEENTKYFRSKIARSGFTVSGHEQSPIVPIMLYDAKIATEFSQEMLTDYGIYVIGFSFPVVPRDQARIRVQVSANHTKEQMDHCIKAFIEIGQKKGIIKN